MALRSLYCTADSIGTATGGGVVTRNESEALRAISDSMVALGEAELAPSRYRQPDSVFLFDYLAFWRVRDERFDLAHLYSGGFPHTVRWLKEHGARVAYTVPAHDRRTTIEEHVLQGMEYPYHNISDENLWAIFSQGYREADVVVAPSSAAAKFLEIEGCQNVAVIPHGCHLPERVPPLPESFNVGYMGQAGPDKGVTYLLKAWEMLNYNDATLVLASRHEDYLRSYIQRNIRRGRFKVLGFVPDLADFYEQVSVYAQPSICESFGIELLEAFAHARPVIASEGAGASELIEEGTDGWVVPIRSPQAIAERIEQARRSRLAEMGLRCRERAAEFTWDRIRGRYQQVWRGVLSG